jgi:hypothetical protein
VRLLEGVVADFGGLRDVSSEAARAQALSRQPETKKALARQRAADDAEARALEDLFELEAALSDETTRAAALAALRDRLSRLAESAVEDSADGRQARRILRGITAGAAARVNDSQYRALLERYGLRGR